MGEFVIGVWVVIQGSKSEIAFIIDPYSQWVPISNQYPLSDVKLFPIDNQRIFNVFLDDDHPTTFTGLDTPDDVVVISQDLNAFTSVTRTWLYQIKIL